MTAELSKEVVGRLYFDGAAVVIYSVPDAAKVAYIKRPRRSA